VELLVSPTGEVESVKLLTQPARVMSAMMLSAIKTWRFAPASHDGRPVRYRLLLRLTNE
jgi:outer membrane biosynthesis protein TonB